MSLFRGP
ncbi:hypothetical protein B4U80_00220 [Leptotrombidium deliense]|nr:hypothetical protein B4U80_00220 [Leptotrombidium deliense]